MMGLALLLAAMALPNAAPEARTDPLGLEGSPGHGSVTESSGPLGPVGTPGRGSVAESSTSGDSRDPLPNGHGSVAESSAALGPVGAFGRGSVAESSGDSKNPLPDGHGSVTESSAALGPVGAPGHGCVAESSASAGGNPLDPEGTPGRGSVTELPDIGQDSGQDTGAATTPRFEQRGFIENGTLFYPQSAPNDDGHVVDDTLLRWEASYRITPWLKISGVIDAETDSHREVDREFHLDWDGRSVARPAFSVRRLSATIHKGKVTAEIGRQFIRWGQTDILTPTDRFAPRDYSASVVNSDFLGVIAARVTIESGADTYDLVWQPWFTPSRTPLLDQRWTAVPQEAQGIGIVDDGARYPGGSQYGARWTHRGAGYDFSLCFFDGFNNLPLFSATLINAATGAAGGPAANAVALQRYYPELRLYGADAAVPLAWFTVKGEAAYFTSTTAGTDEYALYVIQLERQVKEWSFAGGYAGDVLTRTGNPLEFAPDRGFARSFVGHAGWTIDAARSLTFEAAVRAAGSFVRSEYSQTFGQHWRATAGFAWIRGELTDFLGEYRRNSYGSVVVRYSF